GRRRARAGPAGRTRRRAGPRSRPRAAPPPARVPSSSALPLSSPEQTVRESDHGPHPRSSGMRKPRPASPRGAGERRDGVVLTGQPEQVKPETVWVLPLGRLTWKPNVVLAFGPRLPL